MVPADMKQHKHSFKKLKPNFSKRYNNFILALYDAPQA